MATILGPVPKAIIDWVQEQPVFFVATAPLAADGHVNCSPKGGTAFAFDGHTFCYLDRTGSGAETAAHLRQNGRICVMFCAFDGPPRIIRLHGRGQILQPGEPLWTAWADHLQATSGDVRGLVYIDNLRVSQSCGSGVPLLDFVEQRPHLANWADKLGPEGLAAYRDKKNRTSIDGLPALP